MGKANKTQAETKSVSTFLAEVEPAARAEEGQVLVDLFTRVTGQPPVLWGPSIIGFGSYHYRYESGREGDAPRVAFSPRKAKLVCYLKLESVGAEAILARLGKHSTGKGCLYINKLSDIDLGVLEELVADSYRAMAKAYPS
ncbi:DUF1801 domain-containing protein [Aquidulcibacter sp.]|uniref:DUF1801 domain-containing protein n=1 Tax=Aquidulcibacter sp. TaxID=2052990 RepID=UPI0025C54B10|nr:DUF1801 domain-containing protein [Aquidulcibacter sp.]MCA3696163.1 DUF1801 domain-containing protein [Aquidulcibacter sp.]